MDNLNEMGLVEVDPKQLKVTEGGFIALTILGVTYTATQVAAAAGVIFMTGAAVGVAAAAN